MTATHDDDDDATTWRDRADALTPEQAARFERHEATALHSIAADELDGRQTR